MQVQYIESAPHPALRRWVKCYWLLEKHYTAAHPAEIITPDGYIDLVVHLEGQYFTTARQRLTPCPTSFLVGPLSQSLRLLADGHIITAGIRFYSYGVSLFAAISALTPPITDAAACFRSQLPLTISPQNAFQRFDAFLLNALHIVAEDVLLVKSAADYLWSDTLALSQLPEQVHFTLRTLQRKFAQVIGLSPKRFTRIARFNALKNRLILAPEQNLTEVAHDFQYFDQAHFIRDFRQIMGQTPSVFVEHVKAGDIRFYR